MGHCPKHYCKEKTCICNNIIVRIKTGLQNNTTPEETSKDLFWFQAHCTETEVTLRNKMLNIVTLLFN